MLEVNFLWPEVLLLWNGSCAWAAHVDLMGDEVKWVMYNFPEDFL